MTEAFPSRGGAVPSLLLLARRLSTDVASRMAPGVLHLQGREAGITGWSKHTSEAPTLFMGLACARHAKETGLPSSPHGGHLGLFHHPGSPHLTGLSLSDSAQIVEFGPL